jgi:predicted Zn-dependent protease
MAQTARMAQIQALLADNPHDEMLRYMLGMEHASAGDDAGAVAVYRALIADTKYVPASLMAGPALIRLDRIGEACEMLREGVKAAAAVGNSHAQGEMQGLLDSIE